ncbi:MAG TPA: hypothetical protein DC049_00445, partial [Spirochaetia bacterium]|nr:hypothetical protein [Spirochaetia bacterium]
KCLTTWGFVVLFTQEINLLPHADADNARVPEFQKLYDLPSDHLLFTALQEMPLNIFHRREQMCIL